MTKNKKELLEDLDKEIYIEKSRRHFSENVMKEWDMICYLASKIKAGKAMIVNDRRGFKYTKIK